MDIKRISSGKNPPHEVNVIIEIPLRAEAVKYEFDKESGAMTVDRFLNTSMTYPCNYGFIPHTLSGDGDPCDVLVICDHPLIPSVIISVRPICVLLMEDESGFDEKIIAVPTSNLTSLYDKILSYEDLPEILLQKIAHFFEHYKKLEKNKWVKLIGYDNKEKALLLIEESIKNYKSTQD